MKAKTISVEELALELGRVIGQARKRPVVVTEQGKAPLVLRALSEDDEGDELLMRSPRFRESIRRATARQKAGGGAPLAEARRRLGV